MYVDGHNHGNANADANGGDSALECGAILDVGVATAAIDEHMVPPAKALLARIVAMLTKTTR